MQFEFADVKMEKSIFRASIARCGDDLETVLHDVKGMRRLTDTKSVLLKILSLDFDIKLRYQMPVYTAQVGTHVATSRGSVPQAPTGKIQLLRRTNRQILCAEISAQRQLRHFFF